MERNPLIIHRKKFSDGYLLIGAYKEYQYTEEVLKQIFSYYELVLELSDFLIFLNNDLSFHHLMLTDEKIKNYDHIPNKEMEEMFNNYIEKNRMRILLGEKDEKLIL